MQSPPVKRHAQPVHYDVRLLILNYEAIDWGVVQHTRRYPGHTLQWKVDLGDPALRKRISYRRLGNSAVEVRTQMGRPDPGHYQSSDVHPSGRVVVRNWSSRDAVGIQSGPTVSPMWAGNLQV